MTIKFTRRADSAGWLSVRLSRNNQLTSLCEYTSVDVIREAGKRTYFKIVDGVIAVGEEASLTSANAALAGTFMSAICPKAASRCMRSKNGHRYTPISFLIGWRVPAGSAWDR